MTVDVSAYLDRIGFADDVTLDLSSLEALQRAHMTAVPFENLDVYHQVGVSTDVESSVRKIVGRRRGGWCFEANGAFAFLLRGLGFDVRQLGAAVLLSGPNAVVDHLTLEVMLEEPWLVDVGFGEGFIRPLALNRRGPQDGGDGTYELIPSAQGLTLARDDNGVPVAQYRFKRVHHELFEFESASDRLQNDETGHWRQKRFATRLLDGGPDRVTLITDRLKIRGGTTVTETPVSVDAWDGVLEEWFSMTAPA